MGKAERRGASRISPSLDDLLFFQDLYDLHKRRGRISLGEIASHFGVSKPRVSKRLADLEKSFRANGLEADKPVELLARDRSGIGEITVAGERLYETTQVLIRSHGQLTSMFVSGANRTPAEVRVASTTVILVHVICGALTKYLNGFGDPKQMPRFHILEQDHEGIIESVRRGTVEFGVGPKITERPSWKDIEFLDLKLDCAMYCICPASHRFALEHRDGRRKAVRLDELASEQAFTLHPGLQPGLDKEDFSRPNLGAGGRLSRVASYTTILAFVRMGVGLGILPGWHWVLQEYERQGQLVGLAVPELDKVGIAIYLKKGQRKKLTADAQNVIKAIETHISQLKRRARVLRRHGAPDLPIDLERHCHGYYVSSTEGAQVEWRRCNVEWSRGSRGKVEGTTNDVAPLEEYKFRGELTAKLLWWTATPGSRWNNEYKAVFPAVTHQPVRNVLVGTWTGFDDGERPVSGPFVLSPKPLSSQGLMEVIQTAPLRVFLNAERVIEAADDS